MAQADAAAACGSLQSAGKKRRSWFETGRPVSFNIAVERNNEETDETDITELLLMPFTRQPIMDFGVVATGTKKTRLLCVRNPQCFQQEVTSCLYSCKHVLLRFMCTVTVRLYYLSTSAASSDY